MRQEGLAEAPMDVGTGFRRQDYDPLGHPGGGLVRPSCSGHGSGGNGAWYV